MKKLFTLMAAALMAASVNAQTETPLVLSGGWNAGFVGEADNLEGQQVAKGYKGIVIKNCKKIVIK